MTEKVTHVLTITQMNGDTLVVAHKVPIDRYNYFLDVIQSVAYIFTFVKNNNGIPDEVITVGRLQEKEKEYIRLLHNLDKHIVGVELIFSEVRTLSLDLRIN